MPVPVGAVGQALSVVVEPAIDWPHVSHDSSHAGAALAASGGGEHWNEQEGGGGKQAQLAAVH